LGDREKLSYDWGNGCIRRAITIVVATKQRLTFADYLAYTDGADTRYELVDGELVPMSLGTGEHGKTTKFLEKALDAEIARCDLKWTAERFSVGVQSPRGTRWDTSRIPDIAIITLEQWADLQKREAVIALNEPPPLLVIEVVSRTTATDDYRAKRSEYSVLDIPEYWIVDPIEQLITICILRDGFYDSTEFRGGERIVSQTFPHLELTAEQVFQA
jgi:Uma2 family endonuclease